MSHRTGATSSMVFDQTIELIAVKKHNSENHTAYMHTPMFHRRALNDRGTSTATHASTLRTGKRGYVGSIALTERQWALWDESNTLYLILFGIFFSSTVVCGAVQNGYFLIGAQELCRKHQLWLKTRALTASWSSTRAAKIRLKKKGLNSPLLTNSIICVCMRLSSEFDDSGCELKVLENFCTVVSSLPLRERRKVYIPTEHENVMRFAHQTLVLDSRTWLNAFWSVCFDLQAPIWPCCGPAPLIVTD